MHTKIVAGLMLICWVIGLYAQTPSGLTCEDAIPLGSEYNGNVPGAGTYWYLANSYDLPLKIQFAPADGASQIAPAVEVDFTCTPGVYDDPKLDSIINLADGWGYTMPLQFTCNLDVVDGHNEFSMSVPKTYRDILASFGLTENVTAYIKVTYGGAGGIGLSPDTTFSSCMDRGEIVTLGSVLSINAEDNDTHFVFPLAKWQDDSVRFVWQGTEPADVYLSTICDYTFDIYDDANKIYDILTVQPNDTFKLTNAEIKRALDWPENNGGLYYMKIYSQSSGTLKVEHIPMTPPAGDATLLRYGKSVQLNAHDTTKVFAMPADWTNPTEFISPTQYIFHMYVGRTHDFEISEAIADYTYHKTEDGRWLGLSKDELAALWANATGNYLYVRFDCASKTKVTPYKWSQSDCEEMSRGILPGDTLKSSKNSTIVYRMYYADWVGGDIQLKWLSNTQCPAYIVDTCSPASWNKDDARVISYKNIARRGTWTITGAEWTSWVDRKDPDGYIYLRIIPSTSTNANMVITSSAPAEEDPQCIPVDSVLTIEAWDSYEWRGVTYTESGQHSETVTQPGECDTIYSLHLTIHTTSYDSYEETNCDSINYNGKKYTESGVFTDTLFDADGNRTIMTLNFTIYHSTSSEETMVACDSLFWNGEWRKESGDYEYHTTNAAGCDSTVILHLTVGHSYAITLPEIKACDSYVWGDTTIYDSGTYTRRFKAVHGCDSIVTQTITIAHSYLDVKDVVTAYDSYTWINGMTYHSSINGPVWELSTTDGCDSTVSLNLTIRHLVADTIPHTMCASEPSYEWYGKSYNESGLYSTDTVPGEAVGGVYMDTVHTLNLTVLPLSFGDTTATACESFEWYGHTYEQSGEYDHTLEGRNIHGCDSILTLHLTINHATAGDTTATACEAFTWYGTTYTESGDYNHTLSGANIYGCDSVVTLHLAIYHATSGETTATACESFEWHGTNYTESGDYTFETKNIHGCDSTATLHLTIYHATAGEESRTEYESYTWHGTTYTESGDYTFETKNSHGCDSTATLHLTILPRPHVDYEYDTVYFCQGFNTVHEELISETMVRRYLMYVYESPAEWDYQEGLVLSQQDRRVELDLRHVEQNLEAHYIGELEPVKQIQWTFVKKGETAIETLQSTAEPLWKDFGRLTIEVRFTCGHIFSETIPVGSTEDFENIDAESTTVRKVLKDGQIYMMYQGMMYDVLGRRIKE